MLRRPTSQPIANASLASRTTMGVGGDAEWLWPADTRADVQRALAWAHERHMPVTILGGGSNVIVADGGIAGLVILPAIRGWAAQVQGSRVRVRVGAGEPWDSVTERVAACGWQGVENLSGIPGWAGAAPVQNIGAYGQEVADAVFAVEAIERRPGHAFGRTVILPASACRFSYRHSVFKREPDRYIITAVVLALHRGRRPRADYPGLADALADLTAGPAPTVADMREAVLQVRRAKSMVCAHLAAPADPNRQSAGSFFTNPIVPLTVAQRVREIAATVAPGQPMPEFPSGVVTRHGEPTVKLSAAWLIERAGLMRGFGDGFGHGRVGLSTAHTLAIVNRGGASAADVMGFAALVQTKVREVWGIDLDREPVALGDHHHAESSASIHPHHRHRAA